MLKIKPLIIWLIVGLASLGVCLKFFDYVFPVASVHIDLSRSQIKNKAIEFIKSQGFDILGFDQVMLFSSDSAASVYLQKTVGIKKSNELIQEVIPVWFWRVRFFKELQKEGFFVDLDPSNGKIIHFSHAILEDDKGANLKLKDAKIAAQNFLVSQGVNLKDYELKDNVSRKLKNRTDFSFTWEKKNYKIGEAVLRIGVNICGDKLGSFSSYLKIPEEFFRNLDKELSWGAVLAKVSHILMFVLLVGSLLFLVLKYKQSNIDWKLGLVFTAGLAAFSLLSFFNGLPLLWMGYSDTVSKAMFFTMSLGGVLSGVLADSLMIFAFITLGELFSRGLGTEKMPLWRAYISGKPDYSKITETFVVGYSLGFIFLGYVTVFYLCGQRFFNIWMPPNTYYSNILSTIFPFLFPLTIAVGAAVDEEFTYRMLAVSFLKRLFKMRWPAIVIPALLWGFAHSAYMVFPVYIRGIELTVYGIILALVFLRYGLETVLIAHFVIDAFLSGMPLLKSGNPYFWFSGIAVLALAFVPLVFLILTRGKTNALTDPNV
jgi:hypothetical protein